MEGMVEMSLHMSMQIGYKRTARQRLRLKKRGPSRSLHLVKLFQSNGKRPLPIDFDTKEGTYLPTGENQKYFSRVVGTHVRQFVHPYFDRWANVPEEQKARATGCVYEFFDVNPRHYSKADYKLIVDGIEDIAARRYRQYKANVNAYIRDKAVGIRFGKYCGVGWTGCPGEKPCDDLDTGCKIHGECVEKNANAKLPGTFCAYEN
ncbi:Phospholipase A2 [Forsythia ovata]|uniref:Phospholipase A2 n=1 Tax=Forsythia ovata TaxID=205694 RepID=A0ABD1SKD6_9LAMI